VTEDGDLYAIRFGSESAEAKFRIWAPIVAYLGRWVNSAAPVLDIACDRGYFIRHAIAGERWASDLRDVESFLPPDIRFVQASGLELDRHVPVSHFGTVFMSNYLEHLESSDMVIEQLRVAARLLRPDGRVLVLQPNIKYVGAAYWDFIDHHVPLTDRSLEEAARLAGLRTIRLVRRFLPYTTKSRLPLSPALVQLYLRLPIAWRILGAQTLWIGELGN
jgi:SAM-dependent methyltransferase